MNIAEMHKLEMNALVNGAFTVKTAGKSIKESDGYVQKVVLTDKTGDIQADVFTGRYNPIQRGQKITIEKGMTQPTTEGLKLYVDDWAYPDTPSEPPRYGTHRDEDGWDVIKFLKSEFCEDIIKEIMK
jgi:hypothetical protein